MEDLPMFQCSRCGIMGNDKDLMWNHFEICKGGEIMEAKKIVNIQRTERPNSFEFRYGGVGTQIKVYFENVEDLERQLTELSTKGSAIRQKVDIIKYQFREKGEEKQNGNER